MTDADRHRLPFGPFAPPPVRRGNRVLCLYRDCEVVATGWANAHRP